MMQEISTMLQEQEVFEEIVKILQDKEYDLSSIFNKVFRTKKSNTKSKHTKVVKESVDSESSLSTKKQREMDESNKKAKRKNFGFKLDLTQIVLDLSSNED